MPASSSWVIFEEVEFDHGYPAGGSFFFVKLLGGKSEELNMQGNGGDGLGRCGVICIRVQERGGGVGFSSY